jgi:hypothetical protein
MMNKYIGSVFLLNKAKTFSIIKPLNSTVSHENILLS